MARTKLIDDEVIEKPFNKNQFKRLIGYLKPYRLQMIISLFLMIVASVCSLAGPYLTKIAIDDHISVGKVEGLQWVLLIYVSANAIHSLCLSSRAGKPLPPLDRIYLIISKACLFHFLIVDQLAK